MPFEVRRATLADVDDVARIHVRAWQVGYRDLLPAEYLASLDPKERAARYTFSDPDPTKPDTFVALDGRRVICGFVTVGPAREGTDGAGHLMALYVDPDQWQRGIGRRLIEHGRGELAARGYRDAVLWVLRGNERAHRFYVADGWAPDGPEEERAIWGITVIDRRYRRRLG